MEEQEQIINQLAALAMEGQLAQPIDWKAVGISRDDAYKTMAANVIEQMQTVPEENFAAVAMATITKLLVENYVANVRLRGTQNAE
jgi:hypothetical protein